MQILVVVTSLSPTGCGDAHVQLKVSKPSLLPSPRLPVVFFDTGTFPVQDRTGQMHGGLHSGAYSLLPPISAGAVLLLRQVTALRLSRHIMYLCITADKVAHIFV